MTHDRCADDTNLESAVDACLSSLSRIKWSDHFVVSSAELSEKFRMQYILISIFSMQNF